LLKGKTETLILEAGVSLKEVKKALDFDMSSVVACLATHEHSDHFGKVKEYVSSGIDIYASFGTIKKSGIESHRMHIAKHAVMINIGDFQIAPFNVVHDCVEPLAFLIKHPECGFTLFMTDTMYCPYTFGGLNNIIVEANYDIEIANDKIANGASQSVRDRVLDTHMSIDTVCEFLNANDLKAVNNIVLCHLSDGNSNAKQFKSKIELVAPGKQVWIADKNMTINLNITPF